VQNLRKTRAKTYIMIKTAFPKEAEIFIQASEWFHCFKDW
jgi:hypothetical protein